MQDLYRYQLLNSTLLMLQREIYYSNLYLNNSYTQNITKIDLKYFVIKIYRLYLRMAQRYANLLLRII